MESRAVYRSRYDTLGEIDIDEFVGHHLSPF